jgi:putative ABC transport system permease protein
MIKQYFKQAWNLMLQEKLFSSIYIVGTGLSITIVMILSIIFYLRTANIYPETNRDRLLVVKSATEKQGKSRASSSLSYSFIETCFMSLESAEAVTAIYGVWGAGGNYIQPDGSKEQWPVSVKHVDPAFWTVFPFRFLHGQPFTEADMQPGIRTAVIAASMARRLFGDTEATGKIFHMNFTEWRVCGVVKDASYVTEQTYAQVWIPYAVIPDYKKSSWMPSLGRFQAYILAPSAKDVEKVRAEALENIQKYGQTLKDAKLDVHGQPDRQWQSTFRFFSNDTPDFTKILWQYGMLFLILLLVPAVSLSGMAESRMERRLAEMGVRRAFGAPIGTLMRQILTENFLFTLLGGFLGLMFSYTVILLGSDWIMHYGREFIMLPPEGTETVFSPSMLLNLPVFAIALSVCFLLNLLSALIPAWRASHREIVHSLNGN